MSEERPDTVALPPTGDGSRRALRSASSGGRRHRRRRRPPARRGFRLSGSGRLLRWVGAAAALALVVVLVVSQTGGGDHGGSPPSTTSVPSTGPRTSGLLLQRDATGALVSATLLIVGRSGAGGDLLYLPPGTLLETASLGLVPLRDAAGQSDQLARSAIENVLGELVGGLAVADANALAAAVRPAGTLQVDGRSVTPEAVGEVLARPGTTDLDRLVRHQAFWTAWLAKIGRTGPSGAPSAATLGPLAADIRELAAGRVEHHVLPVQSIGGTGGLYQVDTRKLAALLPTLLPDAPAPAARIGVQVLNGTGAPGTAQALMSLMIEAGARVVLTGNADRFDYAATQVAYYDEAHAGDARRLRDALGVGRVVKSLARVGVVDVTVVVGADFAATSRGTSTTSRGATP